MQERELWIEVAEFPDYLVSNYGEVINKRTNKILKQTLGSNGKPRVTLRHGNKLQQFYVNKLVALCHLPGYRHGVKVEQVNGDVYDNRVTNVTIRGFVPEEDSHNRQGPWGKRVRIVETGQVFASARKLARYLGGDYSSVYRVLRGERHSHMGYTFEYYDGD